MPGIFHHFSPLYSLSIFPLALMCLVSIILHNIQGQMESSLIACCRWPLSCRERIWGGDVTNTQNEHLPRWLPTSTLRSWPGLGLKPPKDWRSPTWLQVYQPSQKQKSRTVHRRQDECPALSGCSWVGQRKSTRQNFSLVNNDASIATGEYDLHQWLTLGQQSNNFGLLYKWVAHVSSSSI